MNFQTVLVSRLLLLCYVVLPEQLSGYPCSLYIFAIVLNDKSKGSKSYIRSLTPSSSVLGTAANYIIYLKALTVGVCGSRSAVGASSHTEEWNMKRVVKLVPEKV